MYCKCTVPLVAVECLSHADTTNLTTWTRNSLEDACLMLLVRVWRVDDCLKAFKENKVAVDKLVGVCDQLKGTRGIHQARAAALLEGLDEHNSSSQSIGYSV